MNDAPNAPKWSDLEPKIEAFLAKLNLDHYKVHETLYGFEEEDFGDLISLLNACKLPRHNSYKDVLREKIGDLLEFTPNDLIVFANGPIYAKYFFQVEMPSNEADRRACGLSPETLEHYKKSFFPNNEYRDKIFEFLPHVVEDTLSFRKITPPKFKKLFIPTLVNTVEIVVIGCSNLEELRDIRGMTYYLLRELFDDIMLFIAEDILFNFSNADRKAIEFLSYFSVNEMIDSQGKRHKPNPILDESNHAWNLTTIRSTMIQHRKAKQALYDKKNALIAIKKRLDQLGLEKKELSQELLVAHSELEECDKKIEALHETLRKLEQSDATEVAFNENGEEKSLPRNVLIAKLFKKEDTLLSDKNAARTKINDVETRLSNKQKEIVTWEKKYAESKELLNAIEASGHPIDKQYDRIKRALAKTLASR